MGGKSHGVEQGPAREDCLGWGNLFLSASLTVVAWKGTERKLRPPAEFRREVTPVTMSEVALASSFDIDSTRLFN